MYALSLILQVSGDGAVAADSLKRKILRFS